MEPKLFLTFVLHYTFKSFGTYNCLYFFLKAESNVESAATALRAVFNADSPSLRRYRKKSQPKKLVDFRDVEDSNNIVKM